MTEKSIKIIVLILFSVFFCHTLYIKHLLYEGYERQMRLIEEYEQALFECDSLLRDKLMETIYSQQSISYEEQEDTENVPQTDSGSAL